VWGGKPVQVRTVPAKKAAAKKKSKPRAKASRPRRKR
jgi:hypothetical protein